MGTHALAPINFRYVQRASPLGRRVVVHLLERPDEVHRRRARSGEDSVGGVEVLAALGRERVAVRRGHADGRRAAHGERADRLRHLRRGRAPKLDLLVREPALVEQDDSARLQAEDLLRF